MALNIGKEVSAMKRMTVTQLRERYEEVFGEACRSNHKQWLVKRIAWRLQANEEGDLSERARRRAAELANDADLRMKAPPPKKQPPASRGRKVQVTITRSHDSRIPMPGTILTREYKGEMVQVTVLPTGFDYEGEIYPSLSPATKRLADAQERVRLGEIRLTEIREETIRLRAEAVSEGEVAAALDDFDPMWEVLSPREQARVLQLLIERVEYDGEGGTVSVTFRPSGIKALAEENVR